MQTKVAMILTDNHKTVGIREMATSIERSREKLQMKDKANHKKTNYRFFMILYDFDAVHFFFFFWNESKEHVKGF